jgi:diguanylate cyclase (GGDEF)-like protein/PAS domain S-box-containing protein
MKPQIPTSGETLSVEGPAEPAFVGSRLRTAALALFLAYGVLALVGLYLSRQPGNIATLWYANAAAIAFMVEQSRRRAAVLLLAAGAANLLANLAFGDPSHTAALFGPPNLLDIMVGTLLLNRTRLHRRLTDSPATFGRFLLMAVALPPLAGATIGAISLQASGGGDALRIWFSWYGGSVLGGVALLPLAISVRMTSCKAILRRLRSASTWALLMLAVGTTLVALLRLPFPFVYLALPLVIAAVVDRFLIVAACVFATSLTAGMLIAQGLFLPPPFTAEWQQVLFYLPQIATVVPALLLSVSVEQARATSEARYRRLYERLQVTLHSIADAVITTDPAGRIQYLNPVAETLTGWPSREAVGRPVDEVFRVIGESDRLPVGDTMNRALGKGPEIENEEAVLIDRAGREIAIEESLSPIRASSGELLGVVMVFRDVTDARATASRLSHLARHDALTGLPNRALILDRLAQNIRFAQRAGSRFAVLFVDLDHFKEVNDHLGHAVGDELLREVADRLVASLRGSDTVGRLGGDEFVVLLSHVDGDRDAADVAAKILAAVSVPHHIGGNAIVVTPSIGIAMFPRDGQDAATLLANADTAMYQAKTAGRHRCEAYEAAV